MKNVLVPQFGWSESISFWKGPLGAPQDFAVYDTAVEVKAQSGSSKPYIQISSLEQMEAQLPNFYLIVNTLATIDPEHEEAFSLNSLIADIRNELSTTDDMTRELFESLIFHVGYIQLEHYETRNTKKWRFSLVRRLPKPRLRSSALAVVRTNCSTMAPRVKRRITTV